MTNRNIHFSRLLDIISGSAIAGANTKVQKSALYKDFDTAKLEDKKLRDLIDSNLPTFYIVDCELIANTTIDALIKDSGKYLQENEDYVATILPKLKASKKELLDGLLKVVGNSNRIPSKPFLPVFTRLNIAYEKLLDDMTSKTTYIGYRNAAARFGSQLRTILKANSVFVASDGNQIVANLPSTSRVVIGPTFESAKRKVNEELNATIADFVNGLGLSLIKYSSGGGFTIGNLINAGHTSAVETTGKLIGINMPMAQEKQFLMAGSGKEEGLEKAIADLYLDADYAITFNQDFTKGATTLLDMQFSFVVSMPQAFNTNELRVGEVSRIKEYIKNTILPSIKEQAEKKFAQGIMPNIADLGASPTITDFVEESILAGLLGRKSNIDFKKSNSASASTTIKTPVVKKTQLNAKVKSSASVANLQIPALQTVSGQAYSLTGLQQLLNNNLQNVIAANMGDGSSKKILNYQTGRFAASVKVEKLSQSREGMITAYYNYMKNPYQTFEPGYKQGSPKTRDPKLLIAKSIREIAATKVGNRLRAVLV